jgi:hypothetical protein
VAAEVDRDVLYYNGCVVISLISASTKSGVISSGESLPFWLISARVHQTLTILLLSSTDGRETLVDLTKTLAEMSQNGKLSPEGNGPKTSNRSGSGLSTVSGRLGSIDNGCVVISLISALLLVFGPFLKLDGYPPWQLRLTEMYCTGGRSHGHLRIDQIRRDIFRGKLAVLAHLRQGLG